MPRRALVVGLGRMGQFHAKALADLGMDVTTLDRDPATGADHTNPNAPALSRLWDAVAIATPIGHLADTAAKWAPLTTHLLVEKPFAPTHTEAIRLAEHLSAHNTKVAAGYIERFNPQVQALKHQLDDIGPASSATFTRWNDRPSPDVLLDLRSHDLDLAHYLGIRNATFDTRAGQPFRIRKIRTSAPYGNLTADLLAHNTSPLHAMWHAFLSGQQGHATPQDAIRVLELVKHSREHREHEATAA